MRYTQQQADLIRQKLVDKHGLRAEATRCYFAMRYWNPYTEEVLAQVSRKRSRGWRRGEVSPEWRLLWNMALRNALVPFDPVSIPLGVIRPVPLFHPRKQRTLIACLLSTMTCTSAPTCG